MTITRADDERMMSTPADWPLRPLLPVKRRRAPGQWPEPGIIHEAEPTVVRLDYPLRPLTLALLRTLAARRYDSLSALLADGWVVD
jgi:hypothetical protein